MMISRCGDWISARVGDEIVMMSAEVGQYIGLNEVGTEIWDMLETPRTEAEICAHLLNEFEIDEATCAAEVAAFLQSLEAQKAVTIEPGA